MGMNICCPMPRCLGSGWTGLFQMVRPSCLFSMTVEPIRRTGTETVKTRNPNARQGSAILLLLGLCFVQPTISAEHHRHQLLSQIN